MARKRSVTGNRRGYYIYGPDFFLIPNKFWRIISENDRVIVEIVGTQKRLAIDKEFLLPTIREPAECAFELSPRPRYWGLVIPPKPPDGLPTAVAEYTRLTDQLLEGKIPAKQYCDPWVSFLWFATREQFGSIVIPEKFRPLLRGVAAHYISQNENENNVGVPVTFYTRSTGYPLRNKAVVAWLNSTVALAFRYRARSWLGAASERMSGDQFDKKIPIIDIRNLDQNDVSRLAGFVERAPDQLPELEEQLDPRKYRDSWRSQLDEVVTEVLGFERRKSETILNDLRVSIMRWIHSSKAASSGS